MKLFRNHKKTNKNIIIYIRIFRMITINNFFQINKLEIFLKKTNLMMMKNIFKLNKT